MQNKDHNIINTEPGAFPNVLRKGINEVLMINKYHMLLVIERLQRQKPKFPRFEHVMIPLGIVLTTLIPLFTTSNYKDVFGIKADGWQVFIVMLTILSAIATIILFIWWIRNCICYKEKTADEVVEEIIEQMAKDIEKSSLPKQNTEVTK